MSEVKRLSAKRVYNLIGERKRRGDELERILDEYQSEISVGDVLKKAPGSSVSVIWSKGEAEEYELTSREEREAPSPTEERAEDRRAFQAQVEALEQARKNDKAAFEEQLKAQAFTIASLKQLCEFQQACSTHALSSLTTVMQHNNALVMAGVVPPDAKTSWVDNIVEVLSNPQVMGTLGPLLTVALAAAEHRGLLPAGTTASAVASAAPAGGQTERPPPPAQCEMWPESALTEEPGLGL